MKKRGRVRARDKNRRKLWLVVGIAVIILLVIGFILSFNGVALGPPIELGEFQKLVPGGVGVVNPPEEDLMLHYKYEELDQGITPDSSDFQNDGIYNGQGLVDGKIDKAISFDGVDDYVISEWHSKMNLRKGVTVSTWIKANSFKTSDEYYYTGLVAYRPEIGGYYNDGFKLDILTKEGDENKDRLHFQIGQWQDASIFFGDELEEDVWYHVAVTYDGRVVKTYINGHKAPEQKVDIDSNHLLNKVVVGRSGRVDESADYFDGLIDDTRVYNYALKEGEIKRIWEEGSCIRIYTARDLDRIREDMNKFDHLCYIQMADIDLEGWDWEPIGGYYYFNGVYDGNGKEIRNLKVIKDPDNDELIGLFEAIQGYDGKTSVVKNLTIRDFEVVGAAQIGALTGGIANALIEDVKIIDGEVKGELLLGGVFGQGGNFELKSVGVENVRIFNSSIFISSGAGGLMGASNIRDFNQEYDHNIILDSYAKNVEIVGSRQLGGLAGTFRGNISGSYADVNIETDAYEPQAGGLVSRLDNAFESEIIDSYATGSINGNFGGPNTKAGGLVGEVNLRREFTNDVTILNSHSSVLINPVVGAGGLVGIRNQEGSGTFSVLNSYWDQELTGIDRSVGGEGKTTAEMKMESTFVGWDFTSIWDIIESETYPFLRWE